MLHSLSNVYLGYEQNIFQNECTTNWEEMLNTSAKELEEFSFNDENIFSENFNDIRKESKIIFIIYSFRR